MTPLGNLVRTSAGHVVKQTPGGQSASREREASADGQKRDIEGTDAMEGNLVRTFTCDKSQMSSFLFFSRKIIQRSMERNKNMKGGRRKKCALSPLFHIYLHI